ncbi:MAG: hypothetical protein SGCHY_000346 [Lobulomycetales sp.]
MERRPVSEELVKEAIQLALSQSHAPLLLICPSGAHETGLVAACMRRLQNWNLNAVLEEYQGYVQAATHALAVQSTGLKQRYLNEMFIETFDLDLITI